MNQTQVVAIAAVAAVAAVAVSGVLVASAQEPPATATASASASASGSAAPKRALRSLADKPPPDGATPRPSDDEWKAAEEVALRGQLPDACSAHLVREWLRIHCPHGGGAVSVVSGSASDVDVRLAPVRLITTPQGSTTDPGGTAIAFPLRRGDRRIVQVTAQGEQSYDGGFYPWPMMLISVQWLDDQPGPWVSVAQELRRW